MRHAVVAVLGIVIPAALVLPAPFHGDQSLFLWFAEEIDRGAVLYRDIWDGKQPGIFVFMWTAGRAFGFDEVGVHLLELLYWIAFALTVVIALRPVVGDPWSRALAPVLSIGLYYASARPFHMTQIEVLAGFPIFLAAWLPHLGFPDRRRSLVVLAGIAGGCVALLKLILLPVVIATWVPAWLERRERTGDALAAALGVGLVFGVAAVYFALHGSLEAVVHTTFVLPADQATGLVRPPLRLVRSVGWFTLAFAVPLAIIAWGVPGLLRTTPPLGRSMIAWIAAAIPVTLVQSWWSYHLLLFAVPVGVLAAIALDRWRRATVPAHARRALTAVIVVASVPVLMNVGRNAHRLWSHDLAMEADDRRAYWEDILPGYGRTEAEVSFLREPTSLPGPIFVFGDPRYQRSSGRPAAIAVNGWSPEFWSQGLWSQVVASFESDPPAYILVQPWAARMLPPAMRDLLADRYVAAREGAYGVWYESRPAE